MPVATALHLSPAHCSDQLCRAEPEGGSPFSHARASERTVWNLGTSRCFGRSAMMIDENGSAALSVLLFSPLFRRLGSALPLARPPWRERCACVAVSQHRWVIADKAGPEGDNAARVTREHRVACPTSCVEYIIFHEQM